MSRIAMWRTLELAAKVAQEDEDAARTLFSAASSLAPRNDGYSYSRGRGLGSALSDIGVAIHYLLEDEKLAREREEQRLVYEAKRAAEEAAGICNCAATITALGSDAKGDPTGHFAGCRFSEQEK